MWIILAINTFFLFREFSRSIFLSKHLESVSNELVKSLEKIEVIEDKHIEFGNTIRGLRKENKVLREKLGPEE